MHNPIRHVVVLGGGTAGWLSAALIKKVLGDTIMLTLVESEDIGTVGVGEATIPPIQHVNTVLGFDEAEFLRETKASIKLAIKFENWRVQGESYFHTFGDAGTPSAFCRFHDHWLRARKLGHKLSLWDYDLNYLAAQEDKFARVNIPEHNLHVPYAYHFDASLYARYLRRLSEAMGVQRVEGRVDAVVLDEGSGAVATLRLSSGQEVSGDLFIDCSGFRALLIQGKLNVGFEDWGHWLPCDRAVAMPSERHQTTHPYTRSIAHGAGWQWRIPLQHRNGNGLVFCSRYYSEDEAVDILKKHLDTTALGEPNVIRFRTGRVRRQWHRNVIAVGLSSGFLEPLESTSIHLIQSAVVRLLKLFPHHGINAIDVEEYNRQSQIEYEQIRDFIILHYHVNERDDSAFWREVRYMQVPDTLQRKIALFKYSGRLFREQEDLFMESSWLQVMLGQGIEPMDYHPMAKRYSQEELEKMLANIRTSKLNLVSKLPKHDDFLKLIYG